MKDYAHIHLRANLQHCNYSARVSGLHYHEFLKQLHAEVSPKTYLEIGVEFGETLKLATCASIAVDPAFKCEQDVIGRKPSCHFFQTTSDAFFKSHSPTRILGGRKIELAFLDGLHWFEVLLRDFMNTEKFCDRNSIIILHDCLPPSFSMTTRDQSAIDNPDDPTNPFPHWWTGDVWKVIPILQKYRPDLKITAADCFPTGLMLITGLNHADRVLETNYASIVRDGLKQGDEQFDRFWKNIAIQSAEKLLEEIILSARARTSNNI